MSEGNMQNEKWRHHSTPKLKKISIDYLTSRWTATQTTSWLTACFCQRLRYHVKVRYDESLDDKCFRMRTKARSKPEERLEQWPEMRSDGGKTISKKKRGREPLYTRERKRAKEPQRNTVMLRTSPLTWQEWKKSENQSVNSAYGSVPPHW